MIYLNIRPLTKSSSLSELANSTISMRQFYFLGCGLSLDLSKPLDSFVTSFLLDYEGCFDY